MMRLGLEPGAAGWKVQTNPPSYSGTPYSTILIEQEGSNALCCMIRLLLCQSYVNAVAGKL